jgi:hypothetical protein
MSDAESLKTRNAADPRRAPYRASRDAEARVLLLIDGFSRKKTGPRTLEGRVKLAKLDFLLRYPKHLATVLASRGLRDAQRDELDQQDSPLESRMMRYRYGPWAAEGDPFGGPVAMRLGVGGSWSTVERTRLG